jgi:hypothetical protein
MNYVKHANLFVMHEESYRVSLADGHGELLGEYRDCVDQAFDTRLIYVIISTDQSAGFLRIVPEEVKESQGGRRTLGENRRNQQRIDLSGKSSFADVNFLRDYKSILDVIQIPNLIRTLMPLYKKDVTIPREEVEEKAPLAEPMGMVDESSVPLPIDGQFEALVAGNQGRVHQFMAHKTQRMPQNRSFENDGGMAINRMPQPMQHVPFKQMQMQAPPQMMRPQQQVWVCSCLLCRELTCVF